MDNLIIFANRQNIENIFMAGFLLKFFIAADQFNVY